VSVRAELFSPSADPGSIVAEQRRLLGLSGDIVGTERLVMHGTAWRMIVAGETMVRTAAYALWMNDEGATFGLRLRLGQGWRSVVGGDVAPVLMVVAPDPNPLPGDLDGRRAQAAIHAYLQRQSGLTEAIGRMAGTAPAQATGSE
jgi:hypothetical protein